MKWWKDLQQKLKDLFEEYGRVAIWTYVVLWAAVIIGSGTAIHYGMEVDVSEAVTDGAMWTFFRNLFGSWFPFVLAIWVAVKLTQPVRIMMTLALTPFVARFFSREPAEALPAE